MNELESINNPLKIKELEETVESQQCNRQLLLPVLMVQYQDKLDQIDVQNYSNIIKIIEMNEIRRDSSYIAHLEESYINELIEFNLYLDNKKSKVIFYSMKG